MNGFLLLNKCKGHSSNYFVQKLKHKLNIKKLGHLGTLDPLAEGLLVLAANKATKFSSFFLDSDKSYRAEITLGRSTSTDDLEGDVIFQSNEIPSRDSIKDCLLSFKGKSLQVPPFFSALKHNGKPLYEYARKGINIEKPARDINIHELNIYGIKNNIIDVEINCSKGTYIRSLARDIGENLGCGAHLSGLIRLSQGPFSVKNAKKLEEIGNKDVIEIKNVFKKYKNGISIKLDEIKNFDKSLCALNNNEILNIYSFNHNYLGLGLISQNQLKSKQLV